MHLAGTYEENGLVTDVVRCKVDRMAALSFFQCQHIKEIMPVKFLHHVFAGKQFPDIPDAKAFSKHRLFLSCPDLPYWNAFHYK